MEKKTLTSLFAESLFRIPDYQRGYAWEAKQWNDFIEDVDALVNDDVKNHYTGTVVVYRADKKAVEFYGPAERLPVVDVVDGQQRLTTCCLHLSIILNLLVKNGVEGYESKIPVFLYSGGKCRLTLNNDTSNFFHDLLKDGHSSIKALSTHQKRLAKAHEHFKKHIDRKVALEGTDYLREVYHAITRKLVFTFYTIEEEAEIGMTFELMNSRGKGLSVLELVKNYLMHWVSRNLQHEDAERQSLTDLVNKNWKTTYTNIGLSEGNEDQCLRSAWILYCTPVPKNWTGYQGFKGDQYFPLRNFTQRSKDATQQAIEQFADGLAKVSHHYSFIISPESKNALSKDETKWPTKILHVGNISNFLPLLVAARMQCEQGHVAKSTYIEMLQALEMFAFRVFLFEGKRSDAGRSSFFSWAHELFTGKVDLPTIVERIHESANYYSPETSFREIVKKPFPWYQDRNLLKYTLYEYELHLLKEEGKNAQPQLRWEDLSDSTIEHILPQNPAPGSLWRKLWKRRDMEELLHDIDNLVLTRDNSSYSNFEFAKKKALAGVSPSYANSDIRQERKIATYANWTPAEAKERKDELADWIGERWKTNAKSSSTFQEIDEDDDEDIDGTTSTL